MQKEEKKIMAKVFRKRAYYQEHPDEALEDHMKAMSLKSDDFIMEKVKKWEDRQKDVQL